ncbi:hypothetical protein K1X84_10655 [bacterium]|nr:hypothetical protein [bacterium]
MTEFSHIYARLMQYGSLSTVIFFIISLFLPVLGIVKNDEQLFFQLGGLVLFLTPLTGLLFLIARLFQQGKLFMAWWAIGLIVLLFGGTWLLHIVH